MTDLRRTSVAVSVVDGDEIPATMRAAAAMPDADYVDLSVLAADDATDWSPEEWARAVLEEGPSVRRFGFIPWRVMLGLRLGPWPSPDTVHGWTIAGRGDDWLRLETASWLMTCHAVVHVADGQVSAALFVRYDNPVAAPWWSLLSNVHRRAMPVILRQGADVLRARRVAA